MSENVRKYSKRGIALLIVLFGLTFWTIQKLATSFQDLESSNQMLSSLLETQSALTKKYAEELVKIQGTLKQTESLLNQVQAENSRLNEKIAKIGQIEELQQKVASLNELNDKLNKELDILRGNDVSLLGIESMADAKSMITKYKQQIHKVKLRIGELQHDAYLAKVQAQKEEDRIEALAGNSGYFIKNGIIVIPNSGMDAKPSKNIKVDVTFAK